MRRLCHNGNLQEEAAVWNCILRVSASIGPQNTGNLTVRFVLKIFQIEDLLLRHWKGIMFLLALMAEQVLSQVLEAKKESANRFPIFVFLQRYRFCCSQLKIRYKPSDRGRRNGPLSNVLKRADLYSTSPQVHFPICLQTTVYRIFVHLLTTMNQL